MRFQKGNSINLGRKRLDMIGNKLRLLGKGNYKDGRSKEKGYKTFMAKKRRARKRHASGNHTLGEWQTLKAQYNWTCPCCKKPEPEVKLTEDHIISLKNGGSDNIENIQPLCRTCNSKKRCKTIKYEN